MSDGRLRVGVNGRVLAVPAMRGWTRYATSLLRALSARDDVELVVFAREEPHPPHLAGVRAEIVRFDAPRELWWDDWQLPRRIRAAGIEVFHALADRGLPARKPCPMVVTLHGSYERAHWRALFPTTRRRLWYWKHELVNARRADAVVTVSETTRRELIALGVCRPERLAHVPLAAATEFRPAPAPDDAAVLARHGVRRPYVLWVGGYDPHKNVELLVDAFERAALPSHRLVLAAALDPGGAPRREAWRARLGERLHLVAPAPDELPALYRGARLLVQPSLWESFGLQVVEAMASGVPVLAASRGALPEILGDAGLLFDPTDAGALAVLLRTLASDDVLSATLQARGLRRARAYDWDRVAAETLDVYRRVLERVSGGRACA